MAFDAFMEIDGIPGESADDKHKDWIEIAAFAHRMRQPASATASNAGGATAERVNHDTFDMEQVLISSVNPSGSAGKKFPTEDANFSYGKIKWTHTQQRRTDGAGGGNVAAGWDLTANRAVA